MWRLMYLRYRWENYDDTMKLVNNFLNKSNYKISYYNLLQLEEKNTFIFLIHKGLVMKLTILVTTNPSYIL